MPTPQWPSPIYTDNDFTLCVPVGIPVFQCPIPITSAKYVFTQEWQSPADFAAVALNTAHPSAGLTPDYSSYKLVIEGPRRDVGGGQVRFTRTYAQVPASYTLPQTITYSFIGRLTTQGTTNITTPRLTWAVEAQVVHDYVLVPTGSYADPLTGTTYAVTTSGDIKIIPQMIYCYQNTVGGALYGGLIMQSEILNPAGSTLPTWPTSDQYNTMIADALTNGFSATKSSVVLFPTNTLAGGPPPTSGHIAGAVNTGSSVLGGLIPAEPSRVDQWLGNIYLRRTPYIQVQ
jgi:hypothetical protein